MKKEKFNFREAYERMDVIKNRLAEIAQGLENDKEREDFTDAEKGERKALYREMDILEMKIKAATPTIEVMRREDIEEANKQMRECIKNGKRFELKISRAVASDFGGNTSGYLNPGSSTNPSPVTMGDIVEPLYAKTILSAIGSPLLTGLKGNYQWPVIETFEATINDEGVKLGDTKIDVTKLIAKPERMGVAVPITREALNETDDLLQLVCTQYMPVAAAALMNKIMFSTVKVAKATNLVGPFVNLKAANKKTYRGEAPTLAELLALKGIVLGANIMPEGLCYVMTETTKALLRVRQSGAVQTRLSLMRTARFRVYRYSVAHTWLRARYCSAHSSMPHRACLVKCQSSSTLIHSHVRTLSTSCSMPTTLLPHCVRRRLPCCLRTRKRQRQSPRIK